MQRLNPLVPVTLAAVGLATGLLLQSGRSALGHPSFVPPVSLGATLAVIGAVLLALAILLRRSVAQRERAVNPFTAVRVLAGARAGQLVGAGLAGFGAGLLVQILTRSVVPPAATWAPMLVTLIGGVALYVCGVIAELLCRVPPSDEDGAEAGNSEPTGGSDAPPTAARERH